MIIATSNPGKIIELQAILNPIQCIPQQKLGITDAEETGLTFVENALIKARHASQCANKPALADDSGLVVAALDGEPGIYSARFSGPGATDERNIELLLKKLASTKEEERQAYFYCAIVLFRHKNDPAPFIATAKLNGIISMKRYGTEGFGYDPVFYLPQYQCTLAQLPAQLKNSLSHRALALKQLKQQTLEEEDGAL